MGREEAGLPEYNVMSSQYHPSGRLPSSLRGSGLVLQKHSITILGLRIWVWLGRQE